MVEPAARAQLARKLIRFGATGLLVTGVHVLITVLFINFVLPSPPLANAIAFASATALSYLINTRWSFSATLGARSLTRFLLVSLIGMTVASSIAAMAEHFRLHYGQGLVLVVIVVPLITFVLHNVWTYRSE